MRENRIIKFRAWDGKYKKMRYKVCIGNLHDEDNYTAHSVYLQPGDTDYKIEPPGQWMNFDEHSDYTIMQFTGLLDKNNNEIYEGDEVEYQWNDSWTGEWVSKSGVVEYNNGEYFPVPNNDSIKEYEVIGNIYENPELLK